MIGLFEGLIEVWFNVKSNVLLLLLNFLGSDVDSRCVVGDCDKEGILIVPSFILSSETIP